MITISLESMLETLCRMPEHCDEYIYYTRVRPYLDGTVAKSTKLSTKKKNQKYGKIEALPALILNISMQPPSEKTIKMLFATEEDLFASIIDARHPFRKLKEIVDFPALINPMRSAYATLGAHGIDVEKGIKALLIQFWEDYSDREMEKAIKENLAIRWFCVRESRSVGLL
jgi:hypothetical protein